MKIAEYLLRTLEENGVRHVFGNPGTTEIPLVKLCERRSGLQYVVALSEVSAVPMADGYARATRSLGVVNLHVAPGLGNGMGNLYTANVVQSPLLVLVGGQDRRFLHTNPLLWGPVERMAETVTKNVFAINRRQDSVFNIKAAIRAALSKPYGPVALLCPPDLLDEDVDALPGKVTPRLLGTLGKDVAIQYALELAAATNPAIVAAEEVHWDASAPQLQMLASALGATVYVAPYTGTLPISSRSEVYGGYLPPSHAKIEERLAPHDTIFFVGGRGLRTTLYSNAALKQRKLWVGHSHFEVMSDSEIQHACIADTRLALSDIHTALSANRAAHSPRRTRIPDAPPGPQVPMHPSRALYMLLNGFEGAIWIDESGLSTSDVRQWVNANDGEYFINGSGGIGWGIGAAVGVALSKPERQVVAVLGDGSSLYASEALWTASHYGTRMLIIIVSNGEYATLNEAASRLSGNAISLFRIDKPRMNFEGLAVLHGWRYRKAVSDADIASFIRASGGCVGHNTLLEVVVDPAIKPIGSAKHF